MIKYIYSALSQDKMTRELIDTFLPLPDYPDSWENVNRQPSLNPLNEWYGFSTQTKGLPTCPHYDLILICANLAQLEIRQTPDFHFCGLVTEYDINPRQPVFVESDSDSKPHAMCSIVHDQLTAMVQEGSHTRWDHWQNTIYDLCCLPQSPNGEGINHHYSFTESAKELPRESVWEQVLSFLMNLRSEVTGETFLMSRFLRGAEYCPQAPKHKHSGVNY